MDLKEYKKVEKLDYDAYCKYLLKKYGPAKYDYMNKDYVKDKRVSRSKEGLYCHHIREDVAIQLSDVEIAKENSYEYQLSKNLLYCDLLEHYYLHILICEKQLKEKEKNTYGVVGVGGIVNFIGPELNDVYCGFQSKQSWRINCYKLIIFDKDVYFSLIKRIVINLYDKYPYLTDKCLNRSFNAKYKIWNESNNKPIYKEITNIENKYSKKSKFKKFICNFIGS